MIVKINRRILRRPVRRTAHKSGEDPCPQPALVHPSITEMLRLPVALVSPIRYPHVALHRRPIATNRRPWHRQSLSHVLWVKQKILS